MNPLLSSLANHLWQSTVFAGIAALLTLLFRKNRARVRHSMWFAASLKFLLPFAVLIALGSHIHLRSATESPLSPLSVAMDDVSQPFTVPVVSSPFTPPTPARYPLPMILFGVWAVGFVGIGCSWLVRWWHIRNAVRAGSPLQLEIPMKAVSSSGFLEPGVYGIFRPVLFLPEGISDRLTPDQLKSVIAHELSHVQHHDNLTAAIQMFVETVFWFHPLVWWIGKQMVAERERACDEEVVSSGSDPRAYAEGILKVCQFYLESPVACVSGVTGSDLKKRVERIMKTHVGETLCGWRKAFLLTGGLAALMIPVFVGVMTASRLRAQTPTDRPKFDTTSVKLNNSGRPGLGAPNMSLPGRITATNTNLRILVAFAYGLTVPQASSTKVAGLPTWGDSDHFDIEAVAQGNPTTQDKRLMLQSLLADRFKMVAHYETRQLPVYALMMVKPGKLGLQLQPHTDDSKCTDPSTPSPAQVPGTPVIPRCGAMMGVAPPGGTMTPGGSFTVRKETMDALASFWSGYQNIDRPVIDKTGLSGSFDLTLYFAPEFRNPSSGNPQPNPNLSGIFTAIQEQLGLKLEPTTGPVDVLVIDHVEEPSPN